MGDETIDPELRRYQEEIEALAERARKREIDKKKFENDLKKLVLAAIALAFLLGGGDDSLEARQVLAEQESIGRESVDKLSDEIYNDEFAASGPDELGPTRTDTEGKDKLANRLVMWSTAIAGVYALGQVHTPPTENEAGDMVEQNYVWRLGATIDHCSDCLNLDGQVHTAAEWRSAGIEPQSPDLECGGYHCDCRLERTELESIGENF